MNFLRIWFHQAKEHVAEDGARVAYRAQQFYHVEEAKALEYIAAGVAELEADLVARLAREKAAAEAAEAASVAQGSTGPAEVNTAPAPSEMAKPEAGPEV